MHQQVQVLGSIHHAHDVAWPISSTHTTRLFRLEATTFSCKNWTYINMAVDTAVSELKYKHINIIKASIHSNTFIMNLLILKKFHVSLNTRPEANAI